MAGQSPPLGQEPDIGNLDIDYSYFDNTVWPSISHRVPAFKNIKVRQRKLEESKISNCRGLRIN